MSMNSHAQESNELWLAQLHKRHYYANEIAELIKNLPLDQSRKIKDLCQHSKVSSPEEFQSYFNQMHEIPAMPRLSLLIKKYHEYICCYSCGLVSIIIGFLFNKIDSEVSNSTLH